MRFLVASALAVCLACCAPRPAGDFQLVSRDEIPDGSTVVYVYRPSQLIGGTGCNMRLGDELMGALASGRYTVRFLEPGTTRFTTVGVSIALVTVNLHAGDECFIRQRWVLGPTGIEPRLDHMTRIKAIPELRSLIYVSSPTLLEEPAEDE